MSVRTIAFLKITIPLLVIGALVLIFPKALGFVEMGAREVRYLWWMILLVALAAWLIWGLGGKKK
ncbi:MAG TPA: hypothetical protein VH597_13480 [Verrucomicrobiae bacterium]|jgi:hypothetical protein|nr:hypothetical protein [Verrucomicrobiae bacterium]